MASKLSQLRRGITASKVITLSGDLRVAIVVLSSDTLRKIESDVQQWGTDNPGAFNEDIKNQMYDIRLCYECMRDPDDLNVKLADSVEETGKLIDREDIARIIDAYGKLMVNKAPKIELLTEEELDEIKKSLEKIHLNDLDTVSCVHLKNYHLTRLSKN